MGKLHIQQGIITFNAQLSFRPRLNPRSLFLLHHSQAPGPRVNFSELCRLKQFNEENQKKAVKRRKKPNFSADVHSRSNGLREIFNLRLRLFLPSFLTKSIFIRSTTLDLVTANDFPHGLSS